MCHSRNSQTVRDRRPLRPRHTTPPAPTTQSQRSVCRTSAQKGKKPASGDKKWLEWIDTERQGNGFIDWKPFNHPTLGEVEIGGFIPYAKLNPPAEMIEDIAGKQTSFIEYLMGLVPQVKIAELKCEDLGGGIFKMKAKIQNTGN